MHGTPLRDPSRCLCSALPSILLYTVQATVTTRPNGAGRAEDGHHNANRTVHTAERHTGH